MERARALPMTPPLHAVIDTQTMADGQRLCRRSWRLPGARRAVLLVHGLGEHSGRYARLAGWFHARGYDVRSYDQRGHGLTQGPRGALRWADDLLDDLQQVYDHYARMRVAAPVVLGHSMGGLVAARAVLEGRIRPAALVLSSPALRSWASPLLRRLARVLVRLVPDLRLRTGLDAAALSHDAAEVETCQEDPLCHRWITPRLADFIFRTGPACIADAARLNVPTLLLAAGNDRLVDPAGSRDFAAAACASEALTARYFDTLYHELFNETGTARTQVLKQLGDWLMRQPALA